MSQIKAIIIDDDKPSVEILENALARYSDVNVVATAATMSQARDIIFREYPDILFLDIELNDENALELLRELSPDERLTGMKTVFYTSYNKYLIQALRLNAFDFLLKPFDENDLNLIIERYRNRCCNERITADRLSVMHMDSIMSSSGKRLSVTTVTNEKIILSASDIVYFKYDSHSKLWEVVLNNFGHYILKRHTTADVILSIDSNLVRTHKSFILNISYLSRVSGTECILLPPYDCITEIRISKVYKRQLMERFMEL